LPHPTASASRFSQPLDASTAPYLPALFHAGSAHGVRPSELCSSRAAVRRLRRPCLLAVWPLRELSSEARLPSQAPRICASCRTNAAASRWTESSTSRLCSTRESATRRRLFRPAQARSSPGPSPLQGVHPHRDGYEEPPLMRLANRTQATGAPRFRVSLPAGLADLSRGCRPSWGLLPRDASRGFDLDAVLGSPPWRPRYVTAL
jgi:hypothetical protein